MTDRIALEQHYRTTHAAMRQAQDQSAAADAAQKQAREARKVAEEAFEAARMSLHMAIIAEPPPTSTQARPAPASEQEE